MKPLIALGLFVFSSFSSANAILFSDNQQFSTRLELEQIQALPVTNYTTYLPWTPTPTKYTGVKLSTLLTHVYGEVPEKVDIGALNNYHSTLSRQDILHYQPILAYQKEDHYIKIRDKGPYWVVYPLSLYPELNRTKYHAQMVWQVNNIKIIQK